MRPRTSSFHAFISSFSRNQSSSSWFEVYAAFSTSMILLRTAVNDFIPPVVRSFLISKFKSLFKYSSSRFISLQINEFWDTMQSNQLYVAAKEYMATRVRHHYNVLQIGQLPGKNKVAFSVTSGQKFHDVFDDMKITWTFFSRSLPQPQSQPQLQKNYHVSNQVVSDEKNMYVLSFDEKYREKVLENYIPHVLKMYMNVKEGERVLKIHSLKSPYAGGNSRSWIQRELRHPATFKTLAMEPELKNSIIEDLDRFLKRKEFYNKVGKAWKRGYLLYGPPGTGKSSLIGAMANYLKFDVYDLQLSSIGCDSQLMSAVRTTSNRSILVIEDIDCNEETQKRSTQVEDQMLQFSKKSVKFTLSGLLNYIDGLWSSCGEERIIIFTTNHIDKLDPALIRPGRMDMHINLSYCKAQGFKTLASNYLGIHGSHDHPLVKEIEGLLEKTEVTPAVVAEELMKNENADISLGGLVNFLKRKKMAGEHDMKVVGEGQEGKGDDLQVKEDANLPKSKRPKIVE